VGVGKGGRGRKNRTRRYRRLRPEEDDQIKHRRVATKHRGARGVSNECKKNRSGAAINEEFAGIRVGQGLTKEKRSIANGVKVWKTRLGQSHHKLRRPLAERASFTA